MLIKSWQSFSKKLAMVWFVNQALNLNPAFISASAAGPAVAPTAKPPKVFAGMKAQVVNGKTYFTPFLTDRKAVFAGMKVVLARTSGVTSTELADQITVSDAKTFISNAAFDSDSVNTAGFYDTSSDERKKYENYLADFQFATTRTVKVSIGRLYDTTVRVPQNGVLSTIGYASELYIDDATLYSSLSDETKNKDPLFKTAAALADFRKKYGDGVVTNVQYGAKLALTVALNFRSKQSLQLTEEMTKKVTKALWGLYSSSSFSYLRQEDIDTLDDFDYTIQGAQLGGDPAPLQEINSSGKQKCSIDFDFTQKKDNAGCLDKIQRSLDYAFKFYSSIEKYMSPPKLTSTPAKPAFDPTRDLAPVSYEFSRYDNLKADLYVRCPTTLPTCKGKPAKYLGPDAFKPGQTFDKVPKKQ